MHVRQIQLPCYTTYMKSSLFEKNRLEFFSDAVIAIIITIMVIEFHIPEGTQFSDLQPFLPTFLAYILSFIYLAIYWNNHHHLLKAAKGVNGGIQWANMGLLFCLTLIPFATSWMGKNYEATAPTVVYGIVLLSASITFFILQRTIFATLGKNSPFIRAIGNDHKGKLSPVFYSAAILLAFVHPAIAQIIYVLVALIWIIPDSRIERAVQE